MTAEKVWVIDSSSLIRMKQIITISNQWDAFKLLEEMVRRGDLAICRQVVKEVSGIAKPDVPGAWAAGIRPMVHHPLDTAVVHLSTVMAAAADLVDPDSTGDEADPYVIAQALGLTAAGFETIVVTNDCNDQATKIAMATACDRLPTPWCRVEAFLDDIGVPRGKASEES